MNFKRNSIFVLVVLAFIMSCKKAEDISPIPAISYYSMGVVDTTDESDYLEVVIDFIDGDGNISFYEQDTIKNIRYTLYEMVNNTFVEADIAFPLFYKIPYYEPKGTDKVLQGKIKTKFYLDDLQTFDTIMFKCYIFDRAFNESNVISTPTILVDTL